MEYLLNTYNDGKSCVEKDVEIAKKLKNGLCTFEEVRQFIDEDDCVLSLSNWFVTNSTLGINNALCKVLKGIDEIVPMNERVKIGNQIFHLDAFVKKIPEELLDSLKIIFDRFDNNKKLGLDIVNIKKLLHIADVFNPACDVKSVWYYKFCVTTYLQRLYLQADSIPNAERLFQAAILLIKECKSNDDDEICNNLVVNDLIVKTYGRFCGIGKEHFQKHKTLCVYLFFQYLRDHQITEQERRFACFDIIKNFGRHCKNVYIDLIHLIDVLYLNSCNDEKKNSLFELMCVPLGEDIDVDCFYYVIDKINKQR